MSHRPERIAEAIKKEIADLLRNEIKDPRVGFVTITGVEVTKDLSFAKIFISVMGSEEQRAETLSTLQKAAGYMRSEIGRRIKVRHAPEIIFKLDTSLDNGTRIMELLREINRQEEKTPMNNLMAVAEVIKKAQRPLLCGHVMPDGDSLGSVLALGLGLQRLGKEVTLVSSDPVPDLYHFLPGVETVIVGEVPEGDYDLLVAVDFSVPDRLGSALHAFVKNGLPVAVIDHHVNDHPFGHYNYVRTEAAATGEIIMDLLDLLQIDLNLDLAINLYTAIVTDTGSFRYENTTSETHAKTARLLECGVPVSRLSNYIFGEQPLVLLRLLEAALGTLEVSDCGQIAWMSISREMVQLAGASGQHIEGLINYPRKIKGVELAIVFRELDEQRVKVSFRSKYQVDVNLLAKKFGGGGHVRASGCTVDGPLEQAREMVLKEVKEFFREGSDGRHT